MPDEPRLFTVDEANRVLPLVRPIVDDLLATYAAWVEAVRQYEMLSAMDSAGSGQESSAAEAARRAAAGHAARIDDYVQELRLLGGIFKGFEGGQVDFLSLRDDQPVYLCWQQGESAVSHWHTVEGGFGGRHPIDAHLFSETT